MLLAGPWPIIHEVDVTRPHLHLVGVIVRVRVRVRVGVRVRVKVCETPHLHLAAAAGGLRPYRVRTWLGLG